MASVNIDAVMKRVLTLADEARDAAGYNGSSHDGGARERENQVEWFVLGMRYPRDGRIPKDWESAAADVARAADPEYAEYKRLHAKFG